MIKEKEKYILLRKDGRPYKLTVGFETPAGKINLSALTDSILNVMRRSIPKSVSDANDINTSVKLLALAAARGITSYILDLPTADPAGPDVEYSSKTLISSEQLLETIVTAVTFGYLAGSGFQQQGVKHSMNYEELTEEEYDIKVKLSDVERFVAEACLLGYDIESSLAGALARYNAGQEVLSELDIPPDIAQKVLEMKGQALEKIDELEKKVEEERLKNAN